ncbi:MAG TPA: DUF3011 domain-containing protein [Longimicrobium sp.]|nr:DUF3011 domain-containing protein [Longimicrobium sp.]
MRRLAILAAAVMAAAFAPSTSQAQQVVNCESFDRLQRVCAMDTTGGVRMVRTWSETPCVQGQTWGLARGGVWVSGGCRAQFATAVQAGSGRYNTGVYDNNGYNDRYNNNTNVNTRAVAQAEQLCRQAVRSRVANRRVATSVQNVNRNQVRIAWQMSNGLTGTCRVNSDGNVTLRMNNR